MTRPKNGTDDILIPTTKNCIKLIEQTHTKPQEKLQIKLIKLMATFSFTPSIILSLVSKLISGITSFEV